MDPAIFDPVLLELKRTLQHSDELHRRIFLSEHVDLFLWVDEAGRFASFELAYRDGPRERAIRWKRGIGYSHHRVDFGSDAPTSPNTPLLVPDGPFNRWNVLRKFRRVAGNIDRAVATFVARKIVAFQPAHRPKT